MSISWLDEPWGRVGASTACERPRAHLELDESCTDLTLVSDDGARRQFHLIDGRWVEVTESEGDRA